MFFFFIYLLSMMLVLERWGNLKTFSHSPPCMCIWGGVIQECKLIFFLQTSLCFNFFIFFFYFNKIPISFFHAKPVLLVCCLYTIKFLPPSGTDDILSTATQDNAILSHPLTNFLTWEGHHSIPYFVK